MGLPFDIFDILSAEEKGQKAKASQTR